jgi:Holliday junction resolvase RusA-like endonuclease
MRIVIPGDPIAKARHRLTTQGGFARQYDPQEKEKKAFSQKLLVHMNYRPPFKGPVRLDLIFHLDALYASSKSVTNLRQWQILSAHESRRDLDNMQKFVMDCGNGILWPDDRCIVEISARKVYSKNPCTIINIETLSEGNMTAVEENVYKVFSVDDINDFQAGIWDLYNNLPKYYFSDNSLSQDELARTARSMIEFSNKWADKLKKIKEKNG